MDRLLILRDSDVIRGGVDAGPLQFTHRFAARAVVVNDRGQIALLKVNKHSYHKLPGGGVEPGEDIQAALYRELLEEIGCQVELLNEIGEIVEYRSEYKLKQTSECFLAEQVGPGRAPAFTTDEQAQGFEIVWADTIHSAIKLLKHDKPTNYEGRFIQRRDLVFLEAAKELL